jgi:hypothetical protein
LSPLRPNPHRAALPPTARRAASLTGGTHRPRQPKRADARGVIFLLSLWLTTKAHRGGRRRPRRRRRGVPRTPEHPGRPRVPFHAALFKHHHRTGRMPRNPNHPGEEPLQSHTVRRRRSGGEEGSGEESHPRGSRSPRSRSRPREEPDPPGTPASSASSSSSAPRRRLPPLLPRRPSRPAALHRRVYTSARGHQGEDIRFPPLVDAPAIAPRGNALMPRAAAGEAGLRARLGWFMQVPLPSSTRAPPA